MQPNDKDFIYNLVDGPNRGGILLSVCNNIVYCAFMRASLDCQEQNSQPSCTRCCCVGLYRLYTYIYIVSREGRYYPTEDDKQREFNFIRSYDITSINSSEKTKRREAKHAQYRERYTFNGCSVKVKRLKEITKQSTKNNNYSSFSYLFYFLSHSVPKH